MEPSHGRQELDNKHKFSILHNCHFYQLLPVNFNGKVDTRYSSFSKWNLELVSFWILLDSNNSYLNLEHLIIKSYHRYIWLDFQQPNAKMFDFFRKSSLTLKQQVLKMLQDLGSPLFSIHNILRFTRASRDFGRPGLDWDEI